jgi:hypothetical protein
MFAFLASRRSAPGPGSVVDAPLLDTLADARDAVTAEADAALTPERAAAQRAAILARLGATADTRVLSFPPRAVDDAPVRSHAPRPALGWMLTAAAAGLVVGVGTGQGLYVQPTGLGWQPPAVEWEAPRPMPVQARTVAAPAAVPAVVTDDEPDDAILGEVEFALAGRGVEELQPLDAITPRVTLVAAR